MSDVELEPLCILGPGGATGTSNIGDARDGKGVGADVSVWCSYGFHGGAGVPTTGKAAKALVATSGDHKIVIAGIDARELDRLAAPPASNGLDRFILSACDARFELRQGANTVGLYGDDVSVILDSANGIIALTKGPAQVTVTETAITLQLGPLVLSLSGAVVSIATQSGPPASLSVNGIPVIVP